MTQTHFSGSYLPDDVEFLLTVLDKKDIENTDPATKESLIQSGQKHYSDMLSIERMPDDTHLSIYHHTLQKHAHRYAFAIHHLACGIHQFFLDATYPIVLVSLVRAGTPVGVLLKRAFDDVSSPYHRSCVHYGVSIIKDKGIDKVAMKHLCESHPNSRIVFVDGWTGKGAIFGELTGSLKQFCQAYPDTHDQIFYRPLPSLVVISDPAQVAWLSYDEQDWLLPPSLLNSTISGLISRTLWRDEVYHAVLYYDEFSRIDQSLAFVNTIDSLRQKIHTPIKDIVYHDTPRFGTSPLLHKIAHTFNIDDINRIKPTLAEATRAIIRRDPDVVLLPEDNEDNAFIRHLCQQKNLPILYEDISPYQAITLIKKRH